MRVYTSRLIGSDPDLVMHGGGNTSVKVRRRDLFGRAIEVLHIKGSGWDLETIEARGLPGVRLDALLELRALDKLSDEDMVNVQRCNLLDCTAPTPSVEALLHAYLPHRYVDHTHATAMLALANLPNAAAACREIFGDHIAHRALHHAWLCAGESSPPPSSTPTRASRVCCLPTMATSPLATMRANPTDESSSRRMPSRPGSPGEHARGRIPRERTIRRSRCSRRCAAPSPRSPVTDRDAAMPVFDLRATPRYLSFLGRPDLPEVARSPVATPDHVIRTKGFPLLLPPETISGGRTAIEAAVAAFAHAYQAYFDRHASRATQPKTMLAPTPGLAWIPGLGLVGIGADAQAARIGADLGEQTLRVIALGESAGGFRSIGESDVFDMEYWSLEQAKLGKGVPAPLRGRIVLVTGAAGAIGRAISQTFRANGANVFLVDRDAEGLASVRKSLGRDAGDIAIDLTADHAAETAVAACVERFGGLDIIISNAGAAWTGDMASLPDATLRASFELNFFAHHHLAQAAIAVLRAQGRGGQILFNVSKQAVNPGKGFGAYGLPKAADILPHAAACPGTRRRRHSRQWR